MSDPMSIECEAIRPDELAAIFEGCGLRPSMRCALAVSGGSDSTALMVLFADWLQREGVPAGRHLVLTVDHGLRADSGVEAQQVAAQASRLGFRHATLIWDGSVLRVRKEPDEPGRKKNPIFFHGQETDTFEMRPGEFFIIGDTTFVLVDKKPSASEGGSDYPTPHSEMTCSHQELRNFRFADADQRIEVLASLPALIRLSPSETELEEQVLDVRCALHAGPRHRLVVGLEDRGDRGKIRVGRRSDVHRPAACMTSTSRSWGSA